MRPATALKPATLKPATALKPAIALKPATALLVLMLVLAGCGTGPSSVLVAEPAGVPLVVTLGDSVPAGSACDCAPFPDLYARAQQHAVSENLSVPGATSADVLVQVPQIRTALAGADEVVLMIGANDLAAAMTNGTSFSAAASTVRVNVTATIDAVEQIRPAPVIVLGYWNVVEDGQVGASAYGAAGERSAVQATDQANEALAAAAKATGAEYISTDAAFHGADGDHDPTDLLAADGDHPNAAGHVAIAALLPALPGLSERVRYAGPSVTPARSDPG